MTALLPRTEAPDFRITGAAVDDERLAQVAAQGRITPFALDDDPAAFMGLVRELLGLS